MDVLWNPLEILPYRGWKARQITNGSMRTMIGAYAVRQADTDDQFWVTFGYNENAEKVAGPFDTEEKAKTAAEVLYVTL